MDNRYLRRSQLQADPHHRGGCHSVECSFEILWHHNWKSFNHRLHMLFMLFFFGGGAYYQPHAALVCLFGWEYHKRIYGSNTPFAWNGIGHERQRWVQRSQCQDVHQFWIFSSDTKPARQWYASVSPKLHGSWISSPHTRCLAWQPPWRTLSDTSGLGETTQWCRCHIGCETCFVWMARGAMHNNEVDYLGDSFFKQLID